MELPPHVTIQRRDGRQEILLHRSLAIIGPDKIEIKSARGAILLPLAGLLIAIGLMAYIMTGGSDLPFWALVSVLLICPCSCCSRPWRSSAPSSGRTS
jgi:hypothetical protein